MSTSAGTITLYWCMTLLALRHKHGHCVSARERKVSAVNIVGGGYLERPITSALYSLS